MNSGEYISKLDLIGLFWTQKDDDHPKLVAIGIIRHVNKEFSNAFMGAGTLARYAGLGKTDRVWLALKALEKEHGFIARANRSNGQSNTYRILPQRSLTLLRQSTRPGNVPVMLPETHP